MAICTIYLILRITQLVYNLNGFFEPYLILTDHNNIIKSYKSEGFCRNMRSRRNCLSLKKITGAPSHPLQSPIKCKINRVFKKHFILKTPLQVNNNKNIIK